MFLNDVQQMAHIGEKLEEFRVTRDMDQQQMADFLGISKRSYQTIESTGEIKKTAVIDIVRRKTGITAQKNALGFQNEAQPVKHDNFMVVKYVPVYAQAGYLNNIQNSDQVEEGLPTMLVPKEFEKGNYLVIEVYGDSMDDGTKKAICEGDKLLVKELDQTLWKKKLVQANSVYVIAHRDGFIVKQIIKHDVARGIIVCHSFNPLVTDFTLKLEEVFQLFYVKKIVERRL